MSDHRTSSSSSSNDSDKFVSVFIEFIECAVHCVLKARKIYPEGLFEKRMKYGVSIWRCRHPDVAEYIHKVMINCIDLIRSNLLDSIVFTCADPIDESKTLDKIAFSISLSLSKLNSLYSNGSSSSSSSMAMANGRNQVASNATSSTGSASDPYRSALLKLETELRSVLLKMLVVDTRVPPLPVDANWSLAVVTKNTSSLQEQERLRDVLMTGQWLAEPMQTQTSSTDHRIGDTDINTHNRSSSSSITGNSPLIPLSSFHEEAVSLSINYVR